MILISTNNCYIYTHISDPQSQSSIMHSFLGEQNLNKHSEIIFTYETENMIANKEEIVPISQQSSLLECCMCGDSGLIQELLQCKVCQFRSQHRYCSNMYPKAKSYRVCNWCLNQKEDYSKDKSQNSSNSSASCKANSEEDSKNKKKVDNHGAADLRGSQRNNNLKLHLIKKSIMKPKSAEKSSPCTTRKRITTNAGLQEKPRRTKSEEMSKSALITRQVFRSKVRRYKLLDEVSS